MFIILLSLLFAILYYFGFGLINTIINIMPNINNKNLSPIGITWFISIFLVNIIIIIFIISFYYYKKNNSPGPPGPQGINGETGDDGDICNICNN